MTAPHVFYCLDKGFLACTLVSAFSALENATQRLDITLLIDGEAVADAPGIVRLAQHPNLHKLTVTPLEFDAGFEARSGGLPRATMGRLLARRYMDGRAIYLDGDTLVLGDLADLFGTALRDHPVGAVQDTMMLSWLAKSTKGKLYRGPTYQRILDQRKEQAPSFDAGRYFNAGMLLMDFPKIAQLGLNAAMEDVARAKQYKFQDQDHLNVVFAGRVAWLDPKWNGQWSNIETRRRYFDRGTRAAFAASRSRSSIVHYIGSRKPWQPMTMQRFARMAGIQQLPELPAMLRMRADYAQWRQRAVAFYGGDPFEGGAV
jgi:lipopolysaccharide biosynthesis glycosyltransferase